MNYLRRFPAVLSVCLMAVSTASALNASFGIELERLVPLDDFTIQDEFGYLRPDGSFRVAYSYTESNFGEDIDPALYNRPNLALSSYQIYKSAGVVPDWTRSRDVFYIDGPASGLAYVIVAIKGHDPNPIPVISEQPQSQRILEGGYVFFDVTAEPAAYLSYQWNFKGKPLSGQTDSSLLLENLTSAQAGLYSVSLTTGGKNYTSKRALLQVVKPVAVKTQPKSQSIKVGKPAVFRVALSGTGPFTYQWYYNSALIPNATKSFYSVSHVQSGSAGNYAVMVSNGLSEATSANAVLTVVP